jgi:hypothetical protein
MHVLINMNNPVVIVVEFSADFAYMVDVSYLVFIHVEKESNQLLLAYIKVLFA